MALSSGYRYLPIITLARKDGVPAKSAFSAASFFLLLPWVAFGQGEGDFLSLQRRIIQVYEENRRAVVRVSAAFQNAGEDGKTVLKMGSGFFISREGHVLTNANSTAGATRVWIIHERISYMAELIGSDAYTNVALLRVLSLPEVFNFLHLTDSPSVPPIGTMVLRISSLLEFEPSPFLGLVTGAESRFGPNLFPVPHIRTNIPVGWGEGGAPLLDLNGKLIGIMIAALPPEIRGSYTLPARAALRIRDDLHFSGKISYGWIGIQVKPIASTRHGSQVAIEKVIAETPAEEAGLVAGDVLLRLGDNKIEEVGDVSKTVFYLREGQFVGVTVMRGEEILDFTVPVIARPDHESFEDLVIPLQEGLSIPARAGRDAAPGESAADEPAAQGADKGVEAGGEDDQD